MPKKTGPIIENGWPPLVLEAARAYSVPKGNILSAVERDGVAVIVTSGGARISYRAGDKVAPLPAVQATGVK